MDPNLIIIGVSIGILGILILYRINKKDNIDKIKIATFDENGRVEEFIDKTDATNQKPSILRDSRGESEAEDDIDDVDDLDDEKADGLIIITADGEIIDADITSIPEEYKKPSILRDPKGEFGVDDIDYVDDLNDEEASNHDKDGIHIGSDAKDETIDITEDGRILAGRDIIKNVYSGDIIFKSLENCWNNLPKGKLIYNPPPEMKLGVKERIEVRITKDLTKDLTNGLKGKGIPQEEEIKVSPHMTVHLDGDEAFEIKRLFTKESRAIVGDYTQWDWDVTPLKSGIQKLMLFINAKIEISNYLFRWIEFPILEKEINIKINYNYKIKRFLETYWQWIIATTIALSGAIIALFGLWKKP